MKYRDSGIENAKAVLKQREEKYLLANGWVHTSDTPGHLWLWKKKDSKFGDFCVDTQSAIRIQTGSE